MTTRFYLKPAQRPDVCCCEHIANGYYGDWHKERIIAAIRANKVFGNGTCSDIDEAMTDEEVWSYLVEHNAYQSVQRALDAMGELHKTLTGYAEDIRGTAF